MFRGDLIIDGYNVLYAADLAPVAYGSQGLERARGTLLQMISGKLTPRERGRTTVVFDAPQQILGPSPPREVHELLVMFAGRDGDADATIEQLIQQNSTPRRLCVVSSDRRLQKAARRRRARFLDSLTFLNQLDRRSRRRQSRADEEPAVKRNGGLPPGEVEAWLGVFEGIEDIRSPESGSVRECSPAESNQRPAGSARHRTSKRSASSRNAVRSEGHRTASSDEISFWEARIAELDAEDPSRRD